VPLTYYSNGILGRIHHGAQARIMDGVLGRANALCIGTLWHAFKLAMIPLGLALARVYPPASYAAVFALIWFSYLSCDFASEIFGALFGKQTIAVWGLGDVNKKSIVGTASGFAAAVLVNALVVVANCLPPAWYALALVVAITSTALELRSPTPPARPPRRLSCPPTPSRRPRPRGPTARPSR
jgi:dolichol kinase